MAVRGRLKTKSLDRSNYDSSQKRERRAGRAHSDSGAVPRYQTNDTLPPIASVSVSEASIGGNILRNGPCGPGHDIYTRLLGPTADETILYGLQLLHRMGSTQSPNREDNEEEVETGALSVNFLMTPASEDSATVKVSTPSFSIEEPTSSIQPSCSDRHNSYRDIKEVPPQKMIKKVPPQTENPKEKMKPVEMRDTVSDIGSKTAASVLSSLSRAPSQTETELRNIIVPEESKGDASEISSRFETESTRESETRSKDQKISETDADTFSKSAKETSGSVSCTCTCSVMVGLEQERLEQNRRTVSGCCSCGGIKKSKCSLGKAKMRTCSKCSNRKPSCIRIIETDPEKKMKLCCDCYTSTSSDSGVVQNIKQLEKGDGNQPVGKIKYAITKITDFGKFTTYEVMKSTRKKPKTMPVGLEGVFVLRRCQV